MGAFLDKPKTEKYNEAKSGAGLRYGLSSMQGWRIEMEDAHSAIIGIPDVGDNVSWFAVFDGHAGSRVSAHCSDHLLDCISSVEDFKVSMSGFYGVENIVPGCMVRLGVVLKRPRGRAVEGSQHERVFVRAWIT